MNRPTFWYITALGRKSLAGCVGRWHVPCREMWPVSRWARCEACQ